MFNQAGKIILAASQFAQCLALNKTPVICCVYTSNIDNTDATLVFEAV